MARIFISYRRADPDTTIAKTLEQQLLADGHEVFRDETMQVGTNWHRRIEDELHRMDTLVALLSAQAVESDMVKGEIEKAVKLKKSIIPVRLAYRDELTYPLNGWLNKLTWCSWDSNVDTFRLVKELKRAIAGEEPPGEATPEAPPRERDTKYEERLGTLRKEIEDRLSQVPSLAAELARRLGLKVEDPPSTAQVAAAVLEAKGSDVARALNRLDGAFPQHRKVVREMLWRVLPLVADWRSYVGQVRAAVSAGPNRLELPLRTETIAALVMAGAYGRPAELDLSAKGKGQVRLPAASYAASFSSRQKLLETFLVVLKADGGPKAEVWADIQGQWQDPQELHSAVADQLKEFADPESPDCLPHFLLLVDHAVEDRTDPDAYWKVMVEMGEKFPGLCIVRLTGGPEQQATEITVVNQIQAVLRRPE